MHKEDFLELIRHPLFGELYENGIPFEVNKIDGVKVPGFYKSGHMKLHLTDGEIVAEDRYRNFTIIYTFDALVHLNFVWWRRWQEYNPGHGMEPNHAFLPHFLSKGYLKKVTETTTKYICT